MKVIGNLAENFAHKREHLNQYSFQGKSIARLPLLND
jgi:hypothetical protein